MAYIITGTLTYATQANRDAARTRINTALTGYTYTNAITAIASGVNNSGTLAITFSIQCTTTDPQVAQAFCDAIFNASVSTGRHTSGFLAVNKV